MFGSSVLDVGIGLVLTYLFLSLVVTASNELYATLTRSRATDLERGIRNLLDGKSDVPERWWNCTFRHLKALCTRKKAPAKPEPGEWSTNFFKHQLINALSQDDAMPCYIPSQTFATVLMHLAGLPSGDTRSPAMLAVNQQSTAVVAQKTADVASAWAAEAAATAAWNAETDPAMKAAARLDVDAKTAAVKTATEAAEAAHELASRLAPGQLNFDDIRAAIDKIDDQHVIKKALLALLEEARSDVTIGVADWKKLTVQTEIWFDHAMDRVSGWYIRRTKWFLFAIAIVVTAALNVDTVAICRRLGKDDTLRASVVESAKQYAAQAAKDPVARQPGEAANDPPDLALGLKHVQAEVGRLNGLGIPIGWIYDPIPSDEEVENAIAAVRCASSDVHAQKLKVEADNAEALRNQENSDFQSRLVAAKARLEHSEKKLSRAQQHSQETISKHVDGHAVPRDDDWYDVCHSGRTFFWTKIFGLFLTAFAASLGAPFWFDVLNKFMSVRGSGKAPEEKPKDPKIVLVPKTPEDQPAANAGSRSPQQSAAPNPAA